MNEETMQSAEITFPDELPVHTGHYYKHRHTSDIYVVEKVVPIGGDVAVFYKMLNTSIVFNTAKSQFHKLFIHHNP